MKVTDEMVELLPCPFCGGKAVTYDCGHEEWAIRCVGECKTYHGQEWSTKMEAIAAWNRRAAPRQMLEHVLDAAPQEPLATTTGPCSVNGEDKPGKKVVTPVGAAPNAVPQANDRSPTHGVDRGEQPAGTAPDHQWQKANGVVPWPHCSVCGIIKRRDGGNKLCKGRAKIELRTAPTPTELPEALSDEDLHDLTCTATRDTVFGERLKACLKITDSYEQLRALAERLLAERGQDAKLLRQAADVILSYASDAENSGELLRLATELTDAVALAEGEKHAV